MLRFYMIKTWVLILTLFQFIQSVRISLVIAVPNCVPLCMCISASLSHVQLCAIITIINTLNCTITPRLGHPSTSLHDFLDGSVVKNPPANAGDVDNILSSGRYLEKGNGNPCQLSPLGNPMERGAWRPTVPGVSKEQVMTCQLNNEYSLLQVYEFVY